MTGQHFVWVVSSSELYAQPTFHYPNDIRRPA